MRHSLIFFVLLALAGCAFQPKPMIYLSGLHKIDLPQPQDLGRVVSLSQQVTAEFRGETHEMLIALEVASNEVSMVALAPFGTKLFSVVYQPPLIDSEVSPMLKRQIKPEYVLADMMLIYWPTEALRRYLSRAGLSIEDNGSALRVISLADTVIIRIEYSEESDRLKSRVLYHNIERDYRLTFRTLELE